VQAAQCAVVDARIHYDSHRQRGHPPMKRPGQVLAARSDRRSSDGWPALRELAVAQGIAIVFLACAASQLMARVTELASDQALNRKITHAYLLGPALTGDLLRFGLAIVGLHVAVGFLGWFLSFCVDKAALTARRPPASLVTVACTLLLFAWINLANAALFPWSIAGGGLSGVARAAFAGISVFAALTLALAAGGAFIVLRALARSRVYEVAGPRLLVYPALLVVASLAWRVTSVANAYDSAAVGKPNVILIGIDSLRPDAVSGPGSVAIAPNIDQFMIEAIRFEDTITPLARTFPAWLTVLTGLHPVSQGARENLVPRATLRFQQTLASMLGAQGYQTVYATDEVRFSNIDRSFGFDTVIGPKMGALDFVLGTVNDLPLSNVVSNTWVGRWLFPYTYMNRAAATTYRPETFVREIESGVAFERPTFLAVHLTLPHFPFFWAKDREGDLAEATRQPYLYSNAVAGVDRQLGDLLATLERRGALQNAIVVLLSDHGEGLGLPADNMLFGRAARRAAPDVNVAPWGHGNSVLSSTQYRVMFAWRAYGHARLPGHAGHRDFPASLEDLAPTMVDLLGVHADASFDGMSLVAAMRGGTEVEAAAENRVRFTETGVTVGFSKLGEAKVSELVEQGASGYSVDPQTGRLELKPQFMLDLMKHKERAAISRDRILAAIPGSHGATVFLVVPRAGGMPEVLTAPPDTAEDPGLRRLWDALLRRYPGELASPPHS
jgi:hypothetical protein